MCVGNVTRVDSPVGSSLSIGLRKAGTAGMRYLLCCCAPPDIPELSVYLQGNQASTFLSPVSSGILWLSFKGANAREDGTAI